MNKPIEAGCTCVVVGAKNPENNGKVVKVVKLAHWHDHPTMLNNVQSQLGAVMWEIDTPMLIAVHDGAYDTTAIKCYISVYYAPECNLMRIDDGDFEHEREQERELVYVDR